MRRTLLLAALLTLGFAGAQADLVVLNQDGTSQETPLENVQRISFSGSNVVTTLKDGTTLTTPLAGVQKIYFGNDSGNTGIDQVAITEKESLLINGNTLTANGTGTLRVLSADGRELISRHLSGKGEQVSFDNLPQGVYIVTLNGRSVKLLKK